MGSASTKERSLTPPHANHHSSTTNVLRRGNVAGPSSSVGRLSSTLLSGGGGGGASATGEALSPRGRPRHAEASLFGLGIGRERDREAEREAREQRKAEKERERQKERERSLREESLDGGFLVTQGVYTGVEDFKEKIVRQLMIERRLAPFFKGLSDHEQNWTDAQLVAAVRGLPIPSADVQLETESPRLPSLGKQLDPSDPTNTLIVPIPSRSRAQSYSSEGVNWSGSSAPPFGFSSRSRAKTLSITSPRNLQPHGSPVELNDSSKMVDGRPIEAVLYQNAVECPICFLYYPPYLNRTRCCDQEICSECFVQIKRPDPHLPEHHDDQPNPNAADLLMSEPATCPFCVESEFGVIYTPPPFRRGLSYSAPSSSLSSPVSGTPTSASLPSPLPSPPGRRLALSVNSPEVVTTDRIRPDWSQKLAAARAHAARRAAAATALHTAAYLMPPPSPSSNNSISPPSFASRRLIRRTPPIDQQQPPSPGSSAVANSPAAAAEAFFARRTRLVDIEEMMLLEAIRLSLADEEERRSKPQPSDDDDDDDAGKGKSVDRTSQRGESSGSNTTDCGGPLEGLFNFRSLNEELEHDVSTPTNTTNTTKGGSNKGKVVAR